MLDSQYSCFLISRDDMQPALLWRHGGFWLLSGIVHAVVAAAAVNGIWHHGPWLSSYVWRSGGSEIIHRGERPPVGNLGIGPWLPSGLLAAPPLAAEALMYLPESLLANRATLPVGPRLGSYRETLQLLPPWRARGRGRGRGPTV